MLIAAIVKANKGWDLGYVWKGQGSEVTQPERSPNGYYINAAQGGEAPGRWWGPGAEALGFREGQEVEREPYEKVYRQIHPVTGERMGRSAGNYNKWADWLLILKDAEPHATGERLRELEREAAQRTRQAPAYTDLTVSFSKSLSVFHASIRENARRQREAGDLAGAAYWDDAERRYQEVLQAANRAGLEYVQRWAGITRTGYHGARVAGREAGRFEEALITVTSWLQGTSRDGDPQDHVHNQIARIVQTVSDGKYRALDTVCLSNVLGAVQGIIATHAEAGLTREFGVEWTPRTDGKGNEITGITQDQMDAYSSRRASILAGLPDAVSAWERKYGREPSERELLFIAAEVTLATRLQKDEQQIDWDAKCEQWERKWDARWGGDLASVASHVSALRTVGDVASRGDATLRDADREAGPHAGPSRAELTRAARRALTLTQEKQATWTKSDYLKQLALVLPVSTRAMAPDGATALLEELGAEALAGQFDQVVCLEAPEWPPLPDYLRRELDGRSVYTRPGTPRYATRVQLSMEEQLLRDAQAQGAPRLTRAQMAQFLGVDTAALEAQLYESAQAARDEVTGSGLRLNQAAALYHALTSHRTVEVLVGPAGSGKTRTLALASDAWTKAGKGPVIGITTAQAARNVLAAAGVRSAENSAAFLGHTSERRNVRPIRPITRGTLIVIDEASMMSLPDLHQIISHARRHGAKVIISGDQQQLTAVESGGGMMLLARRLGHVQLAEAVRFHHKWERDASLRLRSGDATVLDEYHEHGRISGAEPEAAMDRAVRWYVANYLVGRDPLLMIADRARCREASRRIRDDLIHLGLVQADQEVHLAEGVRASAGDLIICRKNDHRLEAGERGRTLANGDLLRIEKIVGSGTVLVRRALDCDPETGAQRWSARSFEFRDLRNADLAYAVTGHSAQGRTVRTALALLTGAETWQWLYVAMTRGIVANRVIAFTRPWNIADPKPQIRPAPELDRHQRIERERDGQIPEPPVPATNPAPRDAIGVIADVLDRDGAQASATETQRRALSDADHLAWLNSVWQGETAGLAAERYRRIVIDALPASHAGERLTSHQSTWLWRTLRAAEVAGRDVRQIVTQAIDAHSLTGARDVASVIDARIRKIILPLVPQPPRPWSERVPAVANPERQEFLTRLAAAMDARKERLGEHAAETSPAWAIRALRPVPQDDPLARLEWERHAADIGAYRELYGYSHPTEPVGPEPTGDSPEKRAAWHAAFSAMRPVEGPDLRSLPDGSLLQLRAAYETETAWAPTHVGRELQQIRESAEEASLSAIRAQAEHQIARDRGQHDRAARHDLLSRSFTAMEAAYRQREAELEETMATRREWEQLTDSARRQAVAADSELRRRHPDQQFEPLRSAEPVVTEEERAELVLTAGELEYQTPAWITRLADERGAAQEVIASRRSMRVPSEDPDYEDEGAAWPAWAERDRDAILQPPKPQIQPAAEVAERAVQAQFEREAAD